MDRELLLTIQAIIESDKELPHDVAQKLVLAAMVSTTKQLDELINKVDTVDGRLEVVERETVMPQLANKVDDLEDRVEDLEKNPSLVWLLRYKTKQTITVILTVFVVLAVLFLSYGRQLLLSFAGIDPGIIP